MDGKGLIHLPEVRVDPVRAIWKRVFVGVGMLALVVALVYADRGGYTDTADGQVDLLDAFYYATVTLSTTGYGDIAPVTDGARLVNAVLVTPLRILFLIVLVGTTLEALTARGRRDMRIKHWRKTLSAHTVVVGYGVKGRSAVATLRADGFPREKITVVDPDAGAVSEANEAGYVAVLGDATRSAVLRRAGADEAERVLIATARDDSGVLATLVTRRMNPNAQIIVAVREAQNVDLARQGGADFVVTSSDTVGRILGMSGVSPALGRVMEDLISAGEGLEVTERAVLPQEEGRAPRQLEDIVVAVHRGEDVLPYHSSAIGQLVRGDRVIVVRPAEETPRTTRLGAQPGHGETEDSDLANQPPEE